jgi:hypothetical protein
MKPLQGPIWPLVTLAALAATGYSQEFFREFGTSRSSGGIGRLSPAAEVFDGNDPSGPIDPVREPFTEVDNYNFRLGNLDFILAAGIGVEFNDNITLANRDRLSDIILRPQIDVEGILRISEDNKLRFGVGLSYAKYLDHDEFDSDSVLVSPSSAIAWTAKSGAFTFTVRERFSYQEDPFDLPVLSGVANYKRWENQAGFQVDWDANEYTRISVGYDRYDLWAQDEAFKSQDRGVNTVYIRPSHQISPNVTLGVNASLSFVDFDQPIQADAKTILVGPYIQWKASEFLDVYAEVGYQKSDFDGGTQTALLDAATLLPNGTIGVDNEDSSSFYAKLQFQHRPTETFRHKLSASKTSEVGYGSNYYDLWHFEYTADLKIAENTSLTGNLFYEYYETSGAIGEEASRFGAAIGIHHIFSEHLTLGLDYRYLRKDSNLPDSDYYQNLGLLSLYYKF